MRRGHRLSGVGISVYPSGNTAVAAGGIKQGQRVQSITVCGVNTTRRPGRALASQAVAAGAAAGLGSTLGGSSGSRSRKTKERGENPRPAPPCWKASLYRSSVGSVPEDQLQVDHVVYQHRAGGELILVGDTEDQVLAELVVEADGVGDVVHAHDLARSDVDPAASLEAGARYIPAALVVVEPVGLVERDELAEPAVDVGGGHEVARVRVVQRDVLAEGAHKVPVIPELLADDPVNAQQAVTVPLEDVVIAGGRFILHGTREQELVLHVADQDVLGTGHDVRHREDRAGALGREPDQAILVGEQLEPIGDRKAKLESGPLGSDLVIS